MPIPAFTNDGILPPFLGTEPGESSSLMSPHWASVAEVVNHFATSDNRKAILIGWLLYRQALRRAGLRQGFQWIDGSFVESKEPKDIDIGLFFRRPTSRQKDAAFQKFAANNQKLFRRDLVKTKYNVDIMPVDLDANPESGIMLATYSLQLFSHQRRSFLWKSILAVKQDDSADENALIDKLQNELKSGVI